MWPAAARVDRFRERTVPEPGGLALCGLGLTGVATLKQVEKKGVTGESRLEGLVGVQLP